MRYLYFGDEEAEEYPVTFLVPTISKDDLCANYIDPFGVDRSKVLVMDLHLAPGKKKTPMGEMRQYLTEEIIPVLQEAKTKIVVVTDAEYFKALTKAAKTEVHLGYAMDSEMGDFKVIYVPNYKAKFYDPIKVQSKIDLGMEAVVACMNGNYAPPGTNIMHFAEYPTRPQDIEAWLVKLLEMDCPLTVDIEGFDLKHYKCGIGTISFAWNQHEGIAFPVDYVEKEWEEKKGTATHKFYGHQVKNEPVRAMLKQFFKLMLKKQIYHNIAFDAYVLIYQLFMDDLLDNEGLLEGITVMLDNWDCTKLIAYLATNSCAGNKLGLKDQSHEFAGNYAVDEIADIRRIPLPRLLKYNLVDSMATWFVYNKRYPQMLGDQQLNIYETLFKPSTLDIVQMQLTGMPVNMKRVKVVKKLLTADRDKAIAQINNNPLVQQYQYDRITRWIDQRNAKLVTKRETVESAKEEMKKVKSVVRFNPNSPDQLVELLFDRLNLPVLARTKTKQPSADGDSLENLVHHTMDPQVIDLLEGLKAFKDVDKILGTFIKALENAQLGKDGWHYLFGNFNLGGTVSGRLSSSKPNLQNLPAGSEGEKTAKGRYGKWIKSCFQAPPGWLFMGLDFSSLEDRISALTTKDPEKLKVYTDGYDGHCLRAYAYFPEDMPDIDPTSVESINSIAKLYKPLRGESKAPTFALTYQGTWKTLMTNCGFSEEKAKNTEARYKDLYVWSIKWIEAKLDEASKRGYVETAFGLRVRTPLLAQVIRGTSRTPHEAEAEGRTAGNALGQGWCLLNSRAWNEFMGEHVRPDPVMRHNIRPCAQIHDAGYALVKDDMATVLFMNEHLVNAVNWQDHDDIRHPDVGLGGELSLFYPTWADEMEIPNGATAEVIEQRLQEHLDKLAA